MRQVGAPFEPLAKAAPHALAAAMLDEAGQHRPESGVEAGDLAGRPVLQFLKVDPGFENRDASPDIGAAQGQNALEFHRWGVGGQGLSIETPAVANENIGKQGSGN
jgi:hypothetical protein